MKLIAIATMAIDSKGKEKPVIQEVITPDGVVHERDEDHHKHDDDKHKKKWKKELKKRSIIK